MTFLWYCVLPKQFTTHSPLVRANKVSLLCFFLQIRWNLILFVLKEVNNWNWSRFCIGSHSLFFHDAALMMMFIVVHSTVVAGTFRGYIKAKIRILSSEFFSYFSHHIKDLIFSTITSLFLVLRLSAMFFFRFLIYILIILGKVKRKLNKIILSFTILFSR